MDANNASTSQAGNPYLDLLMEERAAAASAVGPKGLRVEQVYTDEDFARLAKGDDPGEGAIWGAVVFAFVLAAAVPYFLATSNLIAGQGNADMRFRRFAVRWIPSFLVLLAGWASGAKPILMAVLAVAVFAGIWAAQAIAMRRATRTVRAFVALTGIWWLVLQMWGFIWRWENSFSLAEFTILHLSLPTLAMLTRACWLWVSKGVRR